MTTPPATPRSIPATQLATLLLVTTLLTSVTTVFFSTYFSSGHHFTTSSASPHALSRSLPRCPYPIVFNKPGKTGSTFIQRAIEAWAADVGRPLYKCGGVGIETVLRLPECLPREEPDTQACGVMTNHIDIDDRIDELLRNRMPNYRLITSTRYPPHRVVSNYLQRYHIRIDPSNRDISDGLRQYLLHDFDPTEWLPAHFGSGPDLPTRADIACPLSVNTKRWIANIVSRYFIVLDANLLAESNAILRHFSLFQLPAKEDNSDIDREQLQGVAVRSNEKSRRRKNQERREQEAGKVNLRGATECTFSDDVKQLLWNVTCFDRYVHLMLQMRMANLYEIATGQKCFKRKRSEMFSCLQEREDALLDRTWRVDPPPDASR